MELGGRKIRGLAGWETSLYNIMKEFTDVHLEYNVNVTSFRQLKCTLKKTKSDNLVTRNKLVFKSTDKMGCFYEQLGASQVHIISSPVSSFLISNIHKYDKGTLPCGDNYEIFLTRYFAKGSGKNTEHVILTMD